MIKTSSAMAPDRKKKIFEREGNTVKASQHAKKEDVPADRLYLSVLDYFSTGTMKKMA